MLNCRYNDPLIAGDGFQRLHWQKQKEKKEKRSSKNINTSNGGVRAQRSLSVWDKNGNIADDDKTNPGGETDLK